MANYTDKAAKALYPDDFERLKKWRKDFTRPLEPHEVARLQQLSERVQDSVAGTHPGPGPRPRTNRRRS